MGREQKIKTPETLKETALYAPVKAFLEGAGYEVKAEIGAADVVGLRGAEEPVIVELKTGFSLALFHQGIARLAVSDTVYLAVPRGTGRRFLKGAGRECEARPAIGAGADDGAFVDRIWWRCIAIRAPMRRANRPGKRPRC